MHNVWTHAVRSHFKYSQMSVLQFLHGWMMGIKAVYNKQSKYEFRSDSSSSAVTAAAPPPLLRLSRNIYVTMCALCIQTFSSDSCWQLNLAVLPLVYIYIWKKMWLQEWQKSFWYFKSVVSFKGALKQKANISMLTSYGHTYFLNLLDKNLNVFDILN